MVSLVDNLLFHINQYDTFNPIFIHVCTGKKILHLLIVLLALVTLTQSNPFFPPHEVNNSKLLTAFRQYDFRNKCQDRWFLAFDF